MATVKVKFTPSSTPHKEGTLHYQLIHRCIVRNLRTGYKLFPSEWSSNRGEIKVGSATDPHRKYYLALLNARIQEDLLRLQHCIHSLEQYHNLFTVDQIIQLYTMEHSQHHFLLYGRELLCQLTKMGRRRTAETYRKALNSFEHFLQGQTDLAFHQMDSNLMMEYEEWLKAKGNCPNTCSFYMRNLRAIYNRSVEQGLTGQKYPFRHVYTGIDKTKKRAISLQMIRQIRDLPLHKPSLSFARDLFMFSFYTRGMSFVDMAFLKKSDLQQGVLSYRRRKTGQQLHIQWEKPMQQLVDQYGSSVSPYLLPILPSDVADVWHHYQLVIHRVNRNLKKIGQQLGLSFPLTTYVARHAWASIAQSKRVSLAIISQALGHESEKTTRIYLASLDSSVVDQANSAILDSL